jgi:hypothetical protein
MSKPGWGASLEGDVFDLADWTQGLKPDFDPWIEIHDGETILRSALLDELKSTDDIHTHALTLIDRLNGVFALSQQTKPLRIRAIIEFTPGGKRNRTLIVEAGKYELRGAGMMQTDDARINVFGADGKPRPPPPPQPSQAQRWSTVAQNNELLDDAVMYFGRELNWFDIYKALECLEIWAGCEEDFLALGWEPRKQVKRLKRTANWVRHSRQKNQPPDDPMPIKEGRELLARLLRRALS